MLILKHKVLNPNAGKINPLSWFCKYLKGDWPAEKISEVQNRDTTTNIDFINKGNES